MAIQIKLPLLVVFFTTTFCTTYCVFEAPKALASGMSPGTTVVLIDEGVGEASMNVTNTEKVPSLLVSSLYGLPGDNEEIVLLTPPMARVEPGESQLVRFILQSEKPLTTQRLRRVTFEGVPPQDSAEDNQVGMAVAQDLPVLISPKGLKKDLEPWKHIKWSVANNKLIVSNPSAYVVRLVEAVELLPAGQKVALPHPYILAGQTLTVDVPAGLKADTVKIHPANLYGYAAESFSAPIQ